MFKNLLSNAHCANIAATLFSRDSCSLSSANSKTTGSIFSERDGATLKLFYYLCDVFAKSVHITPVSHQAALLTIHLL